MFDNTGTVKVSEEFTRTGIKEYVIGNLDTESYSDESAHAVFEEFSYRLSLKVERFRDLLEFCGVDFFWAVNLGRAKYQPMQDLAEYCYIDSTGRQWEGLDALLAFIRDDVDMESVVNDYWSSRSPYKAWHEFYAL